MDPVENVVIYPATAERWPDLESLFGAKGAYGRCWCQFWRMKRADFNRLKGEGTKAALRAMTLANEVPGVLAYVDGRPIGWCSIGPRETYPALESSRTLKRVDGRPVWSIVCFFVAKDWRRRGLMAKLVRGAVDYAREQGAKIVEGYPVDMQAPNLAGQKLSGCAGYMGLAAVFRDAGFELVARASEDQLIMRYTVA